MAISYIEAIGLGFPLVKCHIVGDPDNYDNLVWEGGPAIPSQPTLDAWIAANPQGPKVMEVTKYEFRKLFTLSERVACDNFVSNPLIPANYKAILTTIMKDLELSAIVKLESSDVMAGVNLLEMLGLLGPGRANKILSNTPPQ